ncbi:MAG TPA: peptidoglycan DD-metalloendopeptidase family protein, partial [Miltoncostaea sp.]|nr:peptidoglycan DD-metalloendopeptidase family protein [Miltoncostaea sp.]
MPLDSVAAADLLARILTDDVFRMRFRRDPVATCRHLGLDDLADELARESARAFQTLEVRESRSSLAGVLLAAAAEGVGVAELVQHVRADGGGAGVGHVGADRWSAANALSRAMPAVHDPGALPTPDHAPPCPLCLLRDPHAPPSVTKCASCGEANPVGVGLCPTCAAEHAAAPGAPPPVADAPPPAPAPAPVAVPVPAGPAAPAPPVDPHAVPALAPLASRYDIGLSSVQSDGAVNKVVISSVNGQPVSATNVDARDLAHELSNLDPASRPSRVGTPWRIASDGFVTGDDLKDRIEVELPPGMSAGRASAVFHAVANGADAPPHPAAPDPPAPAAPQAPVAPAAPASPAAAVADALPVPSAAGAPSVEPIDPSLMTNTNAGGKLHGSEFLVPDAEGAPGPGGNMHAGYDFFAKENAPIRSPIAGKVVEVRASRGTSGQIFGGTVKVQGADGKVWVFRHVTPGSVSVGQSVAAGTEIAKVSPWTDGPEHTHIEVWKTLGGGYNVANMEDPLPYLKSLYGNGTPQVASPVAAGAVPPAPAVPAPPVPAPGGVL